MASDSTGVINFFCNFSDTIQIGDSIYTTYYDNGTYSSRLLFIKYDKYGNIIFHRSLGSKSRNNINVTEIKLKRNDLYLTGYFNGASSFDNFNIQSFSNGFDIFILKIDSIGVAKTIAYTLSGGEQISKSIEVDDNLGVYITGYFFTNFWFVNTSDTLSNNFIQDAYILKFGSFLNNNVIIINRNVNLLVYPNPFSDLIEIEFENDSMKEAIISVYTIQGQKIYNETVLNVNKFKIHSNKLTNGIYILKIIANSNEYTRKIIKFQ